MDWERARKQKQSEQEINKDAPHPRVKRVRLSRPRRNRKERAHDA